ncbi:MAG: hypothetical protein EA376_11760 [Phycisphaeraceae bacterium]|nr:MAG: hypothetical protein EA376_11760 [Phycisphaeraceae bacterium]
MLRARYALVKPLLIREVFLRYAVLGGIGAGASWLWLLYMSAHSNGVVKLLAAGVALGFTTGFVLNGYGAVRPRHARMVMVRFIRKRERSRIE